MVVAAGTPAHSQIQCQACKQIVLVPPPLNVTVDITPQIRLSQTAPTSVNNSNNNTNNGVLLVNQVPNTNQQQVNSNNNVQQVVNRQSQSATNVFRCPACQNPMFIPLGTPAHSQVQCQTCKQPVLVPDTASVVPQQQQI
jgi:hypothetical protein